MRRILALWLPHLSTDRLQRRKACVSPADAPLAIVARIDNTLSVCAVDAKAAKLGLRAGQPLANARAMVPSLDVVEADEAADLKLLEGVADWCDRFTPFVALDFPHGLFLDVTGATHLFGGERAMLDTVRSAIAKQGFTVCAALAGTSLAARALAHYAPGTIVPPSEEERAIAPLPVAALSCDHAHALRRAGLKTIGQVASRGRGELASRFGKDFVFALERTLGKGEKPISPRRPLPDYLAEHRFAEPVVIAHVVSGTLHALAASLAGVLEQRGEGARMLEAAFFRSDGQVRRIAVQTGAPTRDPAIIERLFREKLSALTDPLDPGFGFDLIRLEARLAERAAPEAIGFDSNLNAEKDVAQLIDRLSARFGAHRVMRFEPQDTHIPEAASVAVPAQHASRSKLRWAASRAPHEAPCRPLRLFARPEPVEAVAQVPDGPPMRFRWRRVLHKVSLAEGPERIAMEWWRMQEARPTRDYFRVEDDAGRRFWLYREGLYGRESDNPRWFVHGVFA